MRAARAAALASTETGEAAASSKQRIKREVLPRSGPSRSAATVFRSVPKAGDDDECAPEPARSPRGRARRQESAKSAVEAAVNAAYRVCDEYVRWGKEAASQMHQHEERNEPMRRQGYDQYGTPPLMQWWQDMACMWMSWMTPYAGASHYRDRDRDCRPTSCEPPKSVCTDVSIGVQSKRRTDATVRLQRDPCDRDLRIKVREKPTPAAGKTVDARANLSVSGASLRVTVEIKDEDPVGTYRWCIVDDCDTTFGTISVEVYA